MEKIVLENIDEVIYHDVTDEGLNIYMYVNEKVNNFYMTLNVKYGSIHTEFKPKGVSKFIKVPDGIAHFLEHMMFYQPDKTTAHEYFNKLGSAINACTTNDFTFYEVFASNYFKENLNYLLDYVYTPYYTKENIKTEKGVITEEIKMYEDNPDFKMLMKTMECIWHKNKRKNLISGTTQDIKSITVDDLYTVYNNFYHPKNMFMVISGNFNPYEASVIIKENLASKTFSTYERPLIKEEKESNKVVIKQTTQKAMVSIPKVKIAVKLPLVLFKDYPKDELKMYLNIFLKNQFGLTSQIHDILFTNGLVNTPLAYNTSIYENYVILTLSASSNYIEEVIKIINEGLTNNYVDANLLNRSKKGLISTLVLAYDDIEEVNNIIQDDIITFNQVITDSFKKINSLNIEDMNKIVDLLNFNNKTTIVFKA